MKYIKDIRLFEDAGKHEYGCSMVYFELPMMGALHRIIEEDDVYTDDDSDRSFGLESDPHTTLLYGLHADVEDDEVMTRSKHEKPGDILLSNASCFENDDYDVLKMDASADWLNECNESLSELPHTKEFKIYKPHCTIGYLKKGAGQKYVNLLKGLHITVIPIEIVYSKSDGTKLRETLR
jgi:2'-5' RNA ligase